MKARKRRKARRATFLGTAGALLEGCDVSHYQGDIDWPSVSGAGKHFAYLKATEGSSVTDDNYAANYAGAGSAGLVRGAYHFFRHGLSGATQATHFLEVAQPRAGDLPPVLDAEDPPGNQSVADYVAEMRAFIHGVKSAIGDQSPVLYVSPSFWSSTLSEPAGFDGVPLWIAHYTTHDPTVPDPWSNYSWWQYTRSGTVPGISGNVDLDRFHGTQDDLTQALLKPWSTSFLHRRRKASKRGTARKK